jgi:hypothetical protein
MKLQTLVRWLMLAIFSVGLGVCNSLAQTMGGLFQLLGGMDTVGSFRAVCLSLPPKIRDLPGC